MIKEKRIEILSALLVLLVICIGIAIGYIAYLKNYHTNIENLAYKINIDINRRCDRCFLRVYDIDSKISDEIIKTYELKITDDLFNEKKFSKLDTTIRIHINDELKHYKNYEVVYIKDGRVEKELDATISDDYIVFHTNYLGQFGIIGR